MKALVEGPSDAAALEVVARRLGVEVEPVITNGVTNFVRHLAGAAGGLYDAPEQELVAAAVGIHPSALEQRGFFACDRDLEDELLRSVGVDVVIAVAAQEGDLRRLRTLQHQPEWRGEPVHEQLRRWFGSGGNRKVRYARLLAERLDLNDLPAPLAGLMAHLEG